MIVTSHPRPDPFHVTDCRNILIMRGERELALRCRLARLVGNRPFASISNSVPTRASEQTAPA